MLATANQRPVTAAYPYYIGTSADFFDPGYRAATIYAALSDRATPLTPASFAAVQTSLTDQLAVRIVPALLTALRTTSLSSTERSRGAPTAHLERRHGHRLRGGFGLVDVLERLPVRRCSSRGGTTAGFPCRTDPAGLTVSAENQPSLDEDLEAWTLSDPSNPAFSLPSGQRRTAPQVMRQAFATAVAHLSSTLGGAPATWAWGRLHSREFPALSGARRPGLRPRAGGDPYTPDAADGGLTASTGPSWRMIVTLPAAAPRYQRRGGVPRRAEREPGLTLVRQPDPAVVGRPVPAGPGARPGRPGR